MSGFRSAQKLFWFSALALMAVGGRAVAQTKPNRDAPLEQRIKYLEDRAEIDQLISRLSQILDARDIPALNEVATPEFVAVMTPGLTHMKSLWTATQHIMTERWIDINGDRATVKANLIGSNMAKQLPGRAADNYDAAGRDQYEVRGRYVYSLVRTPQGWRIANTDLTYLWSHGAPPAPKK